MCGIAGVFSTDSGNERVVERMVDQLQHRGPESSATLELHGRRSTCTFGHTRLRIIDVSTQADQPLPNEDETVWITFNGEIYNFPELSDELKRSGHRFRSETDTEVLVHLYEECSGDVPNMLQQLRGMFAFALFDSTRDRMVLARDRLGIKPLYWSSADGRLLFASEVRALAATGVVSTDPDLESVESYLTWGSIAGPRTIFRSVSEIPPGSYLEVSDGGQHVLQWWHPEIAGTLIDPEEATERLAATLKDSVRRHLVADRPIGIFLSSGVDSRAVASIAARDSKVRALTLTFSDAEGDEGEAASAWARRIGAEHTRVPISGKELSTLAPKILSSMDQPTSDGVNTWLVCRAAHEAGLVVALSGLGGDELFGGYPSFQLVPAVMRAARYSTIVPSAPRKVMARALAYVSPGSRGARVLDVGGGAAGGYRAVRGLFSSAELPFDFKDEIDANGARNPRDAVTLLELGNYMRNQLLRDTDQMSMSHSLEVRVPLLDDNVVDLALSIDAGTRTASGKELLRRSAGIDDEVPKRPFSLPFDRWMQTSLHELSKEGLLSSSLPFGELLPSKFRQRLWNRYEKRLVHHSRIWAVAALRLWPRANGLDW